MKYALILLLSLIPAAAAAPPVTLLSGHAGPVFFLAFPRPDLLISASADGARIWNPESGEIQKILTAHGSAAAAYSAAGGLLALSGRDRYITVYSSGAWSEAVLLYVPGGQALSLAFSPDGGLLAAACRDGRLRLWRTKDWMPEPELPLYPGPFSLAGFYGTGLRLATFARGEPLLRVWDLKERKQLCSLKSPLTLAAFFDGGGKRLAAAAADRKLRVWEPAGGPEPLEIGSGPMVSAIFSPGGLLAAAGVDGAVKVWDAGGIEIPGGLPALKGRRVLAFSPSGALIAAGETGGDIRVAPWAEEVWSSTGGVTVKSPAGEILTLLPAGMRLKALRASPDGRHWLVSDGTGLTGWAPAAGLAAEKPDLSPPLLAVSSQVYADGRLTVRGEARDDGRLERLRFSGKELVRNNSGRPPQGDAWPFEITAEVTPDAVPSLEASDFSGKTAALYFNLSAAAAPRYSPGYRILRPKEGAAVFREPDGAGPPLARATGGTALSALGGRGGWLLLAGGGWIKASETEVLPARQAAPYPAAAAERPSQPEPPPEEIPAGRANPRAAAIVIGVRDYADGDIPRADYALEDAAAVKRHLIKALGFDEDKVLLLENPTKGQLETVFGNGGGGRLGTLVRKGETQLLVYYSGHGAADPSAGETYLVPSDARPDYLRQGGFPLSRLYAALRAAGAASTTVVLEACFSGLSHAGPLLQKASPLVLTPEKAGAGGLNVFSSSSAEQVSSWYPPGRRGLFTYYFLKALRAGCCGAEPLRLGSLRDLTAAEVPAAALRLYGRNQTPLFSGDPLFEISR